MPFQSFNVIGSSEKIIHNYPFIYEIGIEKKHWKKETKIRWMMAKTVYIVFQRETQIGVAKQLNTSHYQLSIEDIINVCKENNFQLKCKLIFIGMNGNIDDKDIVVQSIGIDDNNLPVENTIEAINLFSEKPKPIQFQKQEKRQRNYVNFGSCSNINFVRRAGCDM